MKKSYRAKKMKISNFKFQISNSRRDGFTLIEVIISITILSLITVIIGSAFRLGIQAWERGEKETGEAQRLRVLSSLLSQQLKSLYPYKIKIKDKDEEVVAFKGEPDSITFVTTLTDQSYGGLKWVQYIFREGVLLYKEGLLPDKKFEEHIKDKNREEIVDNNLDNFQFSYLAPDDDEWAESWDDAEDVPGSVRINLSHFQPFVVKIQASEYGKKDDASVFEEKKEKDENI
jgi:general secretion pathway protein J